MNVARSVEDVLTRQNASRPRRESDQTGSSLIDAKTGAGYVLLDEAAR